MHAQDTIYCESDDRDLCYDVAALQGVWHAGGRACDPDRHWHRPCSHCHLPCRGERQCPCCRCTANHVQQAVNTSLLYLHEAIFQRQMPDL
jgi:hypothetical protein